MTNQRNKILLVEVCAMPKMYRGFYFHDETPQDLMEALYYIHKNLLRVRILYGDKVLGTIWQHTEYGYIHKTSGDKPTLIIIHNTGRFTGTNQLLENCIMRIEYANKKDGNELYDFKPIN